MRKHIAVLMILVLLIAACGGNSQSTDQQPEPESATTTTLATQPAPTGTPVPPSQTPTSEPSQSPTLVPSDTPTSVPENRASDEEIIQKWRFPVSVSALTSGSCAELKKLAIQLAAGEMDGLEALGVLIAIGTPLKMADEAVDEWDPAADQATLPITLDSEMLPLRQIVGQWLNGETTSADVLLIIDDLCAAREETLRQAITAAKADGCSQEQLEVFLSDVANYLEETKAELAFPEKATPEPDSTATPAPASFASGGIGLNREEWEQAHTDSGSELGFTKYDDDKYWVMFVDGVVWHLEEVFSGVQPDLESARAIAAELVPSDAQLIETYSPDGFPELTVDLYMSESLQDRFESDVWPGGKLGNFIAIYGVFDGQVPRIVLGTGNNP